MTRVSLSCETWLSNGTACNKPAVRGYPAMGGGYHMMCEEHSRPHAKYCVTVAEAQCGAQPDWSTAFKPDGGAA